ncbi:MAG: sulfite exporter TauE/SafE family protein [Pseudomonadota bacterium]
MVEWLPVSLGALAGLVLGLTGAGGSLLAIPLLVYGLGWSFAQAVPVSLLAVSAAAFTGTALAWPAGLVRWRAALVMAAFGGLLTPAGMYLSDRLPENLLLLLFSVVAAVVALRLWRQARATPEDTRIVRARVDQTPERTGGVPCSVDPATGRLQWNRRCFSVIAGTGALSGLLSGALGVGGGFVIVPALRARTGLTMHAAVATSLLAIALTSAAGVTAAAFAGRLPPASGALPFVAGALLGMLAGRVLAPRIAGAGLQQGFAVLMWLVATAMAVTVLSG